MTRSNQYDLLPEELGKMHGLSESIYEMLHQICPYAFETTNIIGLPNNVGELSLLQDVVATYIRPKAETLIAHYLLGNRDIVVKHIIYDWYKSYKFHQLPRYLRINETSWNKIQKEVGNELEWQIDDPDMEEHKKSKEYIDAKHQAISLGLYALFSEFKKPSEYVQTSHTPIDLDIKYLIEYIANHYNMITGIELINNILFGAKINATSIILFDSIAKDLELLRDNLPALSITQEIIKKIKELSPNSPEDIKKILQDCNYKSESPSCDVFHEKHDESLLDSGLRIAKRYMLLEKLYILILSKEQNISAAFSTNIDEINSDAKRPTTEIINIMTYIAKHPFLSIIINIYDPVCHPNYHRDLSTKEEILQSLHNIRELVIIKRDSDINLDI